MRLGHALHGSIRRQVRRASRPLRRVWLALLFVLGSCRSAREYPRDTAADPHGSDGAGLTTAGDPAAREPSDAAAAHPASAFRTVATGASFVRTERKDAEGRNTAWAVVRLDLDQVHLEVRAPPRNRLETLATDPKVALAVNGGFFEADGSPSGRLVSNAKQVNPLHPHAGSGVLLIADRRASVVPTEDARARAATDLAIQCGPRLIEADGTVGIHRDDGRRAARTAACIRRGGRELNLVLAWTRNSDRDGPSLLELAKWLAAPIVAGDEAGCESALNLDGGPSTGLVLREFPDELRKPFGRVPWALVLPSAN